MKWNIQLINVINPDVMVVVICVVILLSLFWIIRFVKRVLSSEESIEVDLDQEFLKLNSGHILEQIKFYRAANSRAQISFLFSIVASAAGVCLILIIVHRETLVDSSNSSEILLKSVSSIICNAIGVLLWSNAQREKKDAREFFNSLRVDSGRYQAWLIINKLKDGAHRQKMEVRLINLLIDGDSTRVLEEAGRHKLRV